MKKPKEFTKKARKGLFKIMNNRQSFAVSFSLWKKKKVPKDFQNQ